MLDQPVSQSYITHRFSQTQEDQPAIRGIKEADVTPTMLVSEKRGAVEEEQGRTIIIRLVWSSGLAHAHLVRSENPVPMRNKQPCRGPMKSMP